LPETLIESELFGHERGSFTGAARTHRGCFERANGGTLFLDEITEMPVDMQVRLLRVLEAGRFSRIGGDQEVATDVRVIAASNRDLRTAVAAGKLREDLMYRLCVIPVSVPALRERGATHCCCGGDVSRPAQRGKRDRETLSGGAPAHRLSIFGLAIRRGLKNVVHRAYVMSDHEVEVDTGGDITRGIGSGGGTAC
jgi:transcriptional regulator with GAF, ATPase, and Fis domain